MYKRLLLQFVGLACAVGSFAYNVGDYVFTADARYKVTSADNLITNGDFSVTNPSGAGFGWTDATGAALSTENWQVMPGEGPDGTTALQSLSAAEGVVVFQAVPFTTAQTLIVSFKIKSPTAATSSITVGDGTYVDVYANADGSASKTADRFQQVATAEAIGTDWTEISYCFTDTVTGGSTGSLIVTLGRLEAGTLIADFHVQEAVSVYDTRISDRAINYAQYLIDSKEFSEGVDDFQAIVTQMKEIASDPSTSDDANSMADLLSSLATAQSEWLDKSSADYISYVSNGQITSSWPKHNNNESWSSYGDWQFTGGAGRWGHSSSAVELNYSYPGNYDLPWGQAAIVTAGVPAGRYMFAIDAYALKYSKKKVDGSYYGADYAVYADYVKAFVGNDSVTYTEVDNRSYNTYTAFGNVAQGDTLKVGIYFPGFETGAGGGTFRVKNAVLRVIGITAADLTRMDYVASIYTQASELKKRLDLAAEDIASSSYPWGKEALQDSVTKYTELYNASLAYVDANGTDLGLDIPEDYDDTLLAAVRTMNSARNTMHSLNEPYTNLVADVATAQSELDDEAYANASAEYRTALQDAVNAANSLISGVTATPDSASFAAASEAIATAQYRYEHSCVTPGHPADEAVVNPYFLENGGTKSGTATGWELTLQSDSKGWLFFGSDDRFEGGNKAYVSRGHTAYSKNKAMQKITISMKGYYEFRCQAYALNTYKSTYNAMKSITYDETTGEVVDSVMKSGINLFFGPENAPDSLGNICTTQTTFGNNVWDVDEVRTYSMGYEKTTDADEVVEFGIDALNNGVPTGSGCNLYGFGGVHVYYWADKQNFTDGISDMPVDVLKNKQSTAVYNLMGVKVADSKANLPKGLYISNGKKFVVK